MCAPELLAVGVVALLFGLPMAARPYGVARLREVVDAIGRKPSGRVEPADWNVALTRVVGLALSAFAVVLGAVCVLG